MRDKLLQVRVDEELLSKLKYLQNVFGFKKLSQIVRFLIEKEWRKEKEE